MRSNPHHQQSQLVRGLKVHQQTLNKLETSPRIKQKVGRKPPTPAVTSTRELKAKVKIILRVAKKYGREGRLRKALEKWTNIRKEKSSKLIGACFIKGWGERKLRRLKESGFRMW